MAVVVRQSSSDASLLASVPSPASPLACDLPLPERFQERFVEDFTVGATPGGGTSTAAVEALAKAESASNSVTTVGVDSTGAAALLSAVASGVANGELLEHITAVTC